MQSILRTILVAAFVLLVPVLAFSQNGDTLNIGGSVPLVLTLTVTPDPDADNLTLVGSTAGNVEQVATVSVSTNNTAGWELYAWSSNVESGAAATSALVNADGDPIGYQVTYTGGEATAAIGSGGMLLKEVLTNTPEVDVPLSIVYDQSLAFPAGYYSDQLTIVLRAK